MPFANRGFMRFVKGKFFSMLNVLKGLSEREIAEMELVDRRAVHDSIEAARKKIKKYFKIL